MAILKYTHTCNIKCKIVIFSEAFFIPTSVFSCNSSKRSAGGILLLDRIFGKFEFLTGQKRLRSLQHSANQKQERG